MFYTTHFSCRIVLKYGVTHTQQAVGPKCIFMLQKRVIRLICGATRMEHTNMLFYDKHILKFPDVVKLKTAIRMFKKRYAFI